MSNIEITPTIELIKKLSVIEKKLKQIKNEEYLLIEEYNIIMEELWKRIPPLENEKVFKKR